MRDKRTTCTAASLELLAFAACAALSISASFCLAQTPNTSRSSTIYPRHLTIDFAVNPLSVDDLLPRLRWKLDVSDRRLRNVDESTFQILVDTSRAELGRNHGDAWDSGKVPSSLLPEATYAGIALVSDTIYYWKVRVWDKQGKASAWSETAGLRISDLCKQGRERQPCNPGPRQPYGEFRRRADMDYLVSTDTRVGGTADKWISLGTHSRNPDYYELWPVECLIAPKMYAVNHAVRVAETSNTLLMGHVTTLKGASRFEVEAGWQGDGPDRMKVRGHCSHKVTMPTGESFVGETLLIHFGDNGMRAMELQADQIALAHDI